MLYVNLFLHTRERGRSTQVGVEPVNKGVIIAVQTDNLYIQMKQNFRT